MKEIIVSINDIQKALGGFSDIVTLGAVLCILVATIAEKIGDFTFRKAYMSRTSKMIAFCLICLSIFLDIFKWLLSGKPYLSIIAFAAMAVIAGIEWVKENKSIKQEH